MPPMLSLNVWIFFAIYIFFQWINRSRNYFRSDNWLICHKICWRLWGIFR